MHFTLVILPTLLLPGLALEAPPPPAVDGRTLPIELLAVEVTPHLWSSEIRYRRAPFPERGALVRVVLRVRDGVSEPLSLRVQFDGTNPAALLLDQSLAWTDLVSEPVSGDRLTPATESRITMVPGGLRILSFNGRTASWGVGTAHTLELSETGSGRKATIPIRLDPRPVRVTRVACLPDPARPTAIESLVVHVSNGGAAGLKLEEVIAHAGRPGDASLFEVARSRDLRAFTPAGVLGPQERSGFRVALAGLPLARGLIEVVVRDDRGSSFSVWAPLRFKPDIFDIGSGWLDIASHNGVVPVTRETFLRLLARMHVNAAHIEQIPGYSDSTGPEGLASRYPLRRMSALRDIARYSADESVPLITGVDAVGEPQMDRKPQDTFWALEPYRDARYPTTITFSADEGFRFYAGIADFPHFDAYRVSAPAPDAWSLYDRWPGRQRLRWGAPLEGIGAMTRTLRELSRPAPIAAWSQNAHENWGSYGGRTRRTPTPDEIRLQAYEALANGVTSLYWYSLQSWSLLAYRDVIEPTSRIGREIRLLEDLYLTADAGSHQRIDEEGTPVLDLNTLVAPESALLFAMDLAYQPDPVTRTFVFGPPRPLGAEFPLPGYLRKPVGVFRVDSEGLHEVSWKPTEAGVRIEDTLDRVNVYLATRDLGERKRRHQRLAKLLERERSLEFDPARSEADFDRLLHDLGFESRDQLRSLSRGRSEEGATAVAPPVRPKEAATPAAPADAPAP